MDIKDKKVTILGGKRSGMALARLAVGLSARAKISEQGKEDCLPQEFKDWALEKEVALEFDSHTREFIEDSDLIVLSPGVRFNALPVQWAKEKEIPVLGEVEFAAQFCTKPIIAVTGSNGKTTVSTLIRNLLEKSGYKTCLCGNVGFPFSGFVSDLGDTDFVVLEISSFQLETVLDPASPFRSYTHNGNLKVKGFRPHVAVILNFSQNHLDRHENLEEYFQAKKRIFLNQDEDDFIVLNGNDPQVRELSSQARSQTVYFNCHCEPDRAKQSQNKIASSPSAPRNDSERENPNYLAVLEVGRILGIDENLCREVFREFEGVEHRLEKVRSLDGVDFINDSKATTAEAALWALKSIDRPIIMICGGKDKNIDFSVLADAVQKKVKKMFVIGEARAKIRRAFGALIDFEECEGLEDAVIQAKRSASEGDCVLLSPMCASFDMFSDFEERGRIFKEIVSRLG